MGVIKRTENLFQLNCCSSEDSINNLSNDESIDDASLNHIQWNNEAESSHLRTSKKHQPTIGPSLVLLKSNCGRKKLNRYNIAKTLLSLSEDDFEEVTIEDFIVNSKSAFSFFSDDGQCLQTWNEFILSSEEQQKDILDGTTTNRKYSNQPLINRALRSLLRKKKLPLGILEYLEQELITFFSAKPTNTYISPPLNSFERLLLHSISSYHHLTSLSVSSDSDNVKLVRVKNPKKYFFLPSQPLIHYLKINYNLN